MDFTVPIEWLPMICSLFVIYVATTMCTYFNGMLKKFVTYLMSIGYFHAYQSLSKVVKSGQKWTFLKSLLNICNCVEL